MIILNGVGLISQSLTEIFDESSFITLCGICDLRFQSRVLDVTVDMSTALNKKLSKLKSD